MREQFVTTFMTKISDKIDDDSLKIIFRQLGEKAEIKRRVHPHLIRHTSATDARDHGMPIEEIKEFLGHADIGTTLEYADVTEAATKSSHKRCVI